MTLPQAIPAIVSAEMLRSLRHMSVWAMRTNSRWSQTLEVGDRVDILPQPVVNTGNYNPDDPDEAIDYTNAHPGAKVTIQIDQERYWAVTLDDVRRRQAAPDLLMSGSMQGSESLREYLDAWVRDLFANVAGRSFAALGAADSAVDLSAALTDVNREAVKARFRNAARAMTDAKIPKEGRWCVVGPVWGMVLNSIFDEGRLSDQVLDSTLRNGFMGTLYGIRVYETSQPIVTAADTNVAPSEIACFGNDYACGLIVQIEQAETLRLESRFADAVRGLMAWGGTIIEADGIFRAQLFYEGLLSPS